MADRIATWGNTYWPWFLVAVSLTFLVPEIYALITNTANTLSDYAWHELHVRPAQAFGRHNAAWLLTQGAFLVTVIWLWRHIWYHQFT